MTCQGWIRLKFRIATQSFCNTFIFVVQDRWKRSQQVCRQDSSLGLWQIQCQFLDFCYGRHRSKSSFNGLEGKDSSENRSLIRSRSDATSAGSQSSLGRGRRTTESVPLQHERVVSSLDRLRPSSNRRSSFRPRFLLLSKRSPFFAKRRRAGNLAT
jgi:hypothetical protein